MTHLGPYELDKVYLGDCVELMRALPDKCVDCVVTSPPYNITTGSRSDGHKGQNPTQNWYEDSMIESEYVSWQIRVINELVRLISDGGVIWYNHKVSIKNHSALHPMRIILNSNATLVHEVIWDKMGASPMVSNCLLKNTHESIYALTSGGKPKIINERAKTTTVWRKHSGEQKIHCAAFPDFIPLACISHTECDSVLDPFSGSGTTGVAAIQTGRRFLGFEIEPRWVDLANKRIEAAKAQGVLNL